MSLRYDYENDTSGYDNDDDKMTVTSSVNNIFVNESRVGFFLTTGSTQLPSNNVIGVFIGSSIHILREKSEIVLFASA